MASNGYVQGFAPDRVPAAALGKWQISTAGGDKARWRHDGRELYYIAPDRKMMAVPVKTGPSFEPGVAVPLFDTNVTGFFSYDVSADGRFLLNNRRRCGNANVFACHRRFELAGRAAKTIVARNVPSVCRFRGLRG